MSCSPCTVPFSQAQRLARVFTKQLPADIHGLSGYFLYLRRVWSPDAQPFVAADLEGMCFGLAQAVEELTARGFEDIVPDVFQDVYSAIFNGVGIPRLAPRLAAKHNYPVNVAYGPAINTYPLPIRSQESRARLLMALYQERNLRRCDSTGAIRTSARTLSELTGITKKHVLTALRKLADAGDVEYAVRKGTIRINLMANVKAISESWRPPTLCFDDLLRRERIRLEHAIERASQRWDWLAMKAVKQRSRELRREFEEAKQDYIDMVVRAKSNLEEVKRLERERKCLR